MTTRRPRREPGIALPEIRDRSPGRRADRALLSARGHATGGDGDGEATLETEEHGPLVAGVPAYFYPHPDEPAWATLAAAPPGTIVVVNPADGPGAAPDPRYLAVVTALHEAGHRILGYVDAGYGTRPARDLLHDIDRHREWHGVEGVFLDQALLTAARLPHDRPLLEGLLREGLVAAANPGQPTVDPRYMDLLDLVVLFEGIWDDYRVTAVPSPPRDARARAWHLVHGAAAAGDMAAAALLARRRGAEVLCVTERRMPNPWDGLPAYWPDELRVLAGGSAGDAPRA